MVEDFMARALELAQNGQGHTSPNPMVGAVLVKDGAIVGEGFHMRAGEAHAEILALQQAGARAQGATLYINLEPCCHYGKTPPCTEALIKAGIAKVYMAMLDPNPLVSGRGCAALAAAGIETHVGMHEQQARIVNEIFIHWITQKRPLVIAKFAMSLDGKIATRTGDARWISGEQSRFYSHTVRNRVDAILVGVDTVIADDPQLTTRLDRPHLHHPLRIVLDSRGRIPLKARILNPQMPGKTILATTQLHPQLQSLNQHNLKIVKLPATDGRVCVKALMDELSKRLVTSVLVEGGATVLASFFAAQAVDRVMAFVAPMIIGGQKAPSPVGGKGVAKICQVQRLVNVCTRSLGEDFLISGELRNNQCSVE